MFIVLTKKFIVTQTFRATFSDNIRGKSVLFFSKQKAKWTEKNRTLFPRILSENVALDVYCIDNEIYCNTNF